MTKSAGNYTLPEEILNGELNFLCSAKHASTQLRQV